jgi:hypothetical protein
MKSRSLNFLLVNRYGSCAEARRQAEKDVGGEALAHFTGNLVTNETAELELRRGVLWPESSSPEHFDTSVVYVRFRGHARHYFCTRK